MYCAQVSVMNHSKGVAANNLQVSSSCFLTLDNNPTSVFRLTELGVLPWPPEADDGAGAGDPRPLIRKHQLGLHD